ncbi:hypothetical protein Scep_011634 [Stephania cephalantha]|uniref:Uncharacterized protein n=1 Tax=Stephania cephalantha TaxID=152367 RepID=A0AAP0JF61_9MAGN
MGPRGYFPLHPGFEAAPQGTSTPRPGVYHRAITDRVFSFDEFVFMRAKLVRRREEHTRATPNQRLMRRSSTTMRRGSPKGRAFGLGSLAGKTRRYADPGASTSQGADGAALRV